MDDRGTSARGPSSLATGARRACAPRILSAAQDPQRAVGVARFARHHSNTAGRIDSTMIARIT